MEKNCLYALLGVNTISKSIEIDVEQPPFELSLRYNFLIKSDTTGIQKQYEALKPVKTTSNDVTKRETTRKRRKKSNGPSYRD